MKTRLTFLLFFVLLIALSAAKSPDLHKGQVGQIGTIDTETLTTTPYKAFSLSGGGFSRSGVIVLVNVSNTDSVYVLCQPKGSTAPANLAAVQGYGTKLAAGSHFFGGSATTGSNSDVWLAAGSGSQNVLIEEYTPVTAFDSIISTVSSSGGSVPNPLGVVLTASAAGGMSTWTNSGAAVTTAVSIPITGSWYQFAASNTSTSTTYYVEFFGTNPTLGSTAPIWWVTVPPGPSGTVEHFVIPVATTTLYVAFVTSLGGSTTAPANTCYVSVGYK